MVLAFETYLKSRLINVNKTKKEEEEECNFRIAFEMSIIARDSPWIEMKFHLQSIKRKKIHVKSISLSVSL